jgi:hypothetical protein
MKRIIILSLFIIGLANDSKLIAQQNITFYNMTSVDQSNRLNPARMPDNKLNIGLPIISNTFINLSNSGFAMNEVIKADGDSFNVDLNSFLGSIKEKNYLIFGLETDILSVGKRIGENNYFSFNATLKTNINFRYDKAPFEVLINGNAPYAGQTKNLSFGSNSSIYMEYGLGYARSLFEKKINVGGKVKFLSGLANISTKKSNLSLYTDPSNYDLTISSDIDVNISGDLDSLDDNPTKYIFGPNKGLAFDLGATYTFSDKLEFSASILDIGYIKWNDEVTNYKSKNPGAIYTFSGVEIDNFYNDTANFEQAFEELVDSLEDRFEIEETNQSYSNTLPTQLYLGANYHFNKTLNAGFVFYSQFYKGNILPGVGISLNKKFGKILGLYGSYSYFNRTATNIGLGFSANLGPIQLYAVSDNVLSVFNYNNAQNTNIRFAINLRFGHIDESSKGDRKAKRKFKHENNDGNGSF